MAWWIYKCNSKAGSHQNAWGDWAEFFDRPERVSRWGRTDYSPSLTKLRPGDFIFAYQTDRNELVGLLTVNRLEPGKEYDELFLEKLSSKSAVKVRPLKKADEEISDIPALQPGPIQTIYEITEEDAIKLLHAAGASQVADSQASLRE